MCREKFTNIGFKHTKRNRIATFVGVCIELLSILSIFLADIKNLIFEITFELHCNCRNLKSWFSPESIDRINKSYEYDDIQKIVLTTNFRWCKLFVMVMCHFHRIVFACQEAVIFFAAVKLQSLTSKSKFSHNLWYNGWRSVCSEMLGPLALQWYWPTKSWHIVLGTMGPYYALLIFWSFIKKLHVQYKSLNQQNRLKNNLKKNTDSSVCMLLFFLNRTWKSKRLFSCIILYPWKPRQAFKYTVLPIFGLFCKSTKWGHAGSQIRVNAQTGLI